MNTRERKERGKALLAAIKNHTTGEATFAELGAWQDMRDAIALGHPPNEQDIETIKAMLRRLTLHD